MRLGGFSLVMALQLAFTASFMRGMANLNRSSIKRKHLQSLNPRKGSKSSTGRLFSTTASSVSTAVPKIAHKHARNDNYELVQETVIDEYGASAALYTHKKSGAQILSVIAPDDNKVFGVTFRTPPDDSTGIPHILEHSVLCGSRKFPVKEPFVDLMKGSLNTFLNAFTYPDRTCYPVASINTKDFYNLIHVYLDAVFHPRAINDPQVLQQEGWHYELEDPSQPLQYKGVVYNEMKGVYSSPDSLMSRKAQNILFPDNVYGVDSGGDPTVIPNLTFEQFKKFYDNYYHPSNSRIYFYGDDDPEKRLALLDGYLSEFNAIPVTSQIAIQPKNLQPTKVLLPFPAGAGQPTKHMVTINWLLNDQPMSPTNKMALGVLDHLLLGTSSSSLRKALTESLLGESVTGGGLSDELIQATFSVGMKGVKAEDVEKVEELIYSTLTAASINGFEPDAIRASLNSIEFSLREFNTGSYPRGLSLMLGMMNNWIYDREPADGVRFEAALAELKQNLAEGKPVFQELLKNLLVSNTHRVTVEMVPDTELETRLLADEANRLALAKEAMSADDLTRVIENAKVLKEAQEREDSPEAKATLPKLELSDIDRKAKEIPSQYRVVDDNQATIVSTPVLSSGILYADVGFDFSDVLVEDLPLLPLLTRMMTESGTKTYDEVTLSRKIGAETGGISVTFTTEVKNTGGVVSDPSNAIPLLLIRGKATIDKLDNLFDLFGDVLLNANLDNKRRAVEILREMKARKESSMITSGHSFGATRLAARYSILGYLGEVTGGVTSAKLTKQFLKEAESDWPSIQARLERMQNAIVRKGAGDIGAGQTKLVLSLAGEEKVLVAAESVTAKFISNLPKLEKDTTQGLSDTTTPAATTFKSLLTNKELSQSLLLPLQDEGLIIPSQVNYVVKGGTLFQPGEKVKGSYDVVSRYLSTGFLWDRVRVMGGAYGGFARFGATSGRFSYLSYRDPNLFNTLAIYDAAPAALLAEVSKPEVVPAVADKEGEGEGEEPHTGLTAEALLQAVIGTVGEMDSPLSPDQKGYAALSRYLTGETAEDRQKTRSDVLDTTVDDFVTFAKKLSVITEKGTVVVFGSETALKEANNLLPENKKLTLEDVLGEK